MTTGHDGKWTTGHTGMGEQPCNFAVSGERYTDWARNASKRSRCALFFNWAHRADTDNSLSLRANV
jgi:hypothetical protein